MAVDLTQSIGQGVQAAQQYGTSAVETKIKNADYANAKDDELMEACKSFEAYFVEQVFKEVEKTIHTDDDSSSYASQMTDYFKDGVIQNLSEKIVDQNGQSLSKMLYEQMKRNYGLNEVAEEVEETAADEVAETEEAVAEEI